MHSSQLLILCNYLTVQNFECYRSKTVMNQIKLKSRFLLHLCRLKYRFPNWNVQCVMWCAHFAHNFHWYWITLLDYTDT